MLHVSSAYNQRTEALRSRLADLSPSLNPMDQPTLPAVLARSPLFDDLADPQRLWLAQRIYSMKQPAGTEIITAGAQGEKFYIILQGTVRVFLPQLDGSQVTVNILGPGDTVGELSLLDEETRSASVETLEDTHFLWMERRFLEEAIQTMPQLSRNLLRILSQRLRFTTNNVQVFAALDVNGRVASQVLRYADRYGQTAPNGDIHIPLRLPQNDIAEMVGASRKRVNQAMVLLKRSGYLSVDAQYHITIQDRPALEQICEPED